MAFKTFNKKTIFPDRDAKLFHHFTISHSLLATCLRERVKQKKDNTVLVTGVTGSGKSTIISKLCFNHLEVMETPSDPDKKMYSDDNFIIEPEEYAKKMITETETVLFWDESRDGLSSKNWNKEINKKIVSRKNKNRKRGLTSFVLLPHEGEVDKSFLKHVTLWIWIKERGIGQVFVAANPRMGGHGLHIPTIIERQNKWLKENPARRVVTPIIHPEYIGNIIFGALSNEQQKRYDALVEKHKATGSLDEDEKEAPNEIDKKELELHVPKMLDLVEKGEIKSKRELWDKLKELTQFEDALLLRHINRHLKIRGFKNFNSFTI